ncbi:hypothetical protein ABZW03_32045 [Kitasatospora sp. NPDC004799]|uniref:hypothetical protein n=1 Tax=Kitasatospora sp. NPDC004799 TaxID=3154460 RepID=UPI0033A4893D
MTHPFTDCGRPAATHYDLARVYVDYGYLPPSEHAHLLALLAIADALRALAPQPQPATPDA